MSKHKKIDVPFFMDTSLLAYIDHRNPLIFITKLEIPCNKKEWIEKKENV